MHEKKVKTIHIDTDNVTLDFKWLGEHRDLILRCGKYEWRIVPPDVDDQGRSLMEQLFAPQDLSKRAANDE